MDARNDSVVESRTAQDHLIATMTAAVTATAITNMTAMEGVNLIVPPMEVVTPGDLRPHLPSKTTAHLSPTSPFARTALSAQPTSLRHLRSQETFMVVEAIDEGTPPEAEVVDAVADTRRFIYQNALFSPIP